MSEAARRELTEGSAVEKATTIKTLSKRVTLLAEWGLMTV